MIHQDILNQLNAIQAAIRDIVAATTAVNKLVKDSHAAKVKYTSDCPSGLQLDVAPVFKDIQEFLDFCEE